METENTGYRERSKEEEEEEMINVESVETENTGYRERSKEEEEEEMKTYKVWKQKIQGAK